MKPDQNKKRCPFCSPLVDETCFASSDNFLAIYNISPILPGHCLIIPKKHLCHFLDIPDNLMLELIQFSRKIIKVLQNVFNTSSYNWTLQEGIEAGQTIDHLHLHIIPRLNNDFKEPGDWYPKLEQKNPQLIDSLLRKKYTSDEMKQITQKMKIAYKQLFL